MHKFRNMFQAEWTKIIGHRWATSLLILIFPASSIMFILVIIGIVTFSPASHDEYAGMTWDEAAIYPWYIPGGEFGRILLLGFTAVVFAGEYQWGTWKNIVPRRQRIPLVLMKFLTVVVFIWVAFIITSLIFLIGMWPVVEIAGGSYFGNLDGEALIEVAGDYVMEMVLAMVATIIAAGYAAMAGMFTRSILGGFLVGFVLMVAEGAILVAIYLVYQVLEVKEIFEIMRFVPFYNLTNLRLWIEYDRPWIFEFEDAGVYLSDTMWFSIAVLTAWVVGLIGLTTYTFRRQDITH